MISHISVVCRAEDNTVVLRRSSQFVRGPKRQTFGAYSSSGTERIVLHC